MSYFKLDVVVKLDFDDGSFEDVPVTLIATPGAVVEEASA